MLAAVRYLHLQTLRCPMVLDEPGSSAQIMLFERGAESVGLDFMAHPFWDKYIEYEERMDNQDRVFAILARIVHTPMHQYARYFERYRTMAPSRPISELAPADMVARFFEEAQRTSVAKPKGQQELETEVRARIDSYYLEIFSRTQAETTKRWTYESEIKRPYYHVTELDAPQLMNWRKYLDFEEAEGDYSRIKFLYERCLVTAANCEEFWLRYARWMLAKPDKQEEVRNIYQRASCIYVPIAEPAVRLHYAHFEESVDRPSVAVAIHEAILMNLPGHTETIVSLANVIRRHYGLEPAITQLKQYIESTEVDVQTRGALVSELARLLWKVKGDSGEARQVYRHYKDQFPDSRPFWASWLEFEIDQPTSTADEPERYQHVKVVYDSIRYTSQLYVDLIKDLTLIYFTYLQGRGDKNAMTELVRLDREIYGPSSVAMGKGAFMVDPASSSASTTRPHTLAENGTLGHLAAQVPVPKALPQVLGRSVNGQIASM